MWCGKSILAWYDYSISKRKDAEWWFGEWPVSFLFFLCWGLVKSRERNYRAYTDKSGKYSETYVLYLFLVSSYTCHRGKRGCLPLVSLLEISILSFWQKRVWHVMSFQKEVESQKAHYGVWHKKKIMMCGKAIFEKGKL